MALNKIKLNSIPQRNKDVVFGFTREQENVSNNNFIMPQMIKYLCLLYLNQNKDGFVVDNTRKDIQLNGDCISHVPETGCIASCYLKNTVYERKHIWKFKIHKCHDNSSIGIYNTKYEFNTNMSFDYSTRYNNNRTGYAISFYGQLTNLSNCSSWGEDSGLEFKEGDIIEIILDFNVMKLYAKKDDKYVHLFDIEKGKYKAAVAMVGDSSVELLSYQEVY
eukprot:530476_1